MHVRQRWQQAGSSLAFADDIIVAVGLGRSGTPHVIDVFRPVVYKNLVAHQRYTAQASYHIKIAPRAQEPHFAV